MRPTKDKQIGLRLTKEEFNFIEELAIDDEISVQEVIRKLIKKVMSV